MKHSIPKGYIPGVGRSEAEKRQNMTHLYKGTFDDPGNPMCQYGWNRDDGQSYSIWRNNISYAGICRTCLRRALKGLDGVTPEMKRVRVAKPRQMRKCVRRSSAARQEEIRDLIATGVRELKHFALAMGCTKELVSHYAHAMPDVQFIPVRPAGERVRHELHFVLEQAA